MLLRNLVQDLEFDILSGDLNIEVSSITYDSRKVLDNSIFIAITGFSVDGHSFIETAINSGAKTIIVEKDVHIDSDIAILKVKDSRNALAKISATFFDNPTKKLNMIGVTGTNGKTSVTYLLKAIYDKANKDTGIIGTNGSIIKNKLIKNKNTTPESLDLQQLFTDMIRVNTTDCIMEVSSHSLSLDRVAYCDFNIGIFTNLTPDHLELHNSMEEYFRAKAKLFYLTNDYNIINVDDPYGKRLAEEVKNLPATLITYGIDNKSDIYATDIEYYADSVSYIANTPGGSIRVKINIPGIIYVYNSLAAIACAYSNNIDLKDIQEGINSVTGIKGRFEIVPTNKDFTVIIDFAHTEDGLEKALTTIKQFAKGRIILVFGVYAAPGEKGSDKRWGMGKVAAKYADLAIVTSDNPKDQDPISIIDEIVKSIKANSGTYTAIVDRKEAIKHAIEISQKDDIIFIAGKGHETTQIIGSEEIPFNESEIVTETINNSENIKIG